MSRVQEMEMITAYDVRNDDASNATYTPASLALGLSVEECMRLAAMCEAYLENCQITTAPLTAAEGSDDEPQTTTS